MLKDYKIGQFARPVSALPDVPRCNAAEMKAAFDASPEELRRSLNGVIDGLQEEGAAGQLGFRRTAGVDAASVQDAIENVHAQTVATALGQIPDGSVDQRKLAQDVRDRFHVLETAGSEEARVRLAADNAEARARAMADETEIEARAIGDEVLALQLSDKTELACGGYTGDGAADRFFSLGFTPRAVFVYPSNGRAYESSGYSYCYSGLAVQGHPAEADEGKPIVRIEPSGFRVFYTRLSSLYIMTNALDAKMRYIALK